MKKFAVLMCVIACVIGIAGFAWCDVPIDAAHFPDPAFREYLKIFDYGWYDYDTNGILLGLYGENDGILDDKEIEQHITYIWAGAYGDKVPARH